MRGSRLSPNQPAGLCVRAKAVIDAECDRTDRVGRFSKMQVIVEGSSSVVAELTPTS
jgi:hypothetical protein